MTLFNQINSLLFALFLLVMSSLVYFQFTETKTFMVNQMESDLNNTVTSLSLMLKPHLETGDAATVDTLVNVIFEGGFYKQVHLTWLADQKQQVWENSITIKKVPQWFINLNLFETQSKEVTITSGWLQLATLKVESNPAIGYRELWRIMNDTLMILAALFLISIMVLRLRLKRILKPLHEVAQHATDVSQRKFHPDMPLPPTKELKEVVGAINSMSGQLKQVFSALDDEVDNLKNNTLRDHVSQLPNRLYFTGQLNSWLDSPGFGALLLADFNWLDDIHSKYGYQVRDETIKVLAQKLSKDLPFSSETLVARISNTEFAFLIREVDKQQVSEYLQGLIRLINQEMLNAGSEPNQGFAIGISERSEGVSRAELLSQADNALQKSLNENKRSNWFFVEEDQEFSREDWRDELVEAIDQNKFLFQWQHIQQCRDDKVIHREIYCRLEVAGKVIRAGQFMPYIERFSLGHKLDRCLLESIESNNLLSLNSEPIAVNLSRESITNPDFHLWLASYLSEVKNPEKLHFEMPEAGITQNLTTCLLLCDIITQGGAKFGVDNCGRQMGSLTYLQQLKPYYIKLDMSLSCYNNEENEENQQNLELCRALVNIARGLNIKAIITGIEDEKHLNTIKPLRAEGYQGYIMPPVEIDKR
ncbi:bifunctional diguanylate cyclase/phosphodiesterase [Psychromonas sp. Urea-02u-13]|uniref:bifunctional diguanylate cyclase/phosphodiesterase n=1 Tax=Psychromonas sp. Urea-02u-13 TaxID=2058326 RepID=UPI000C34A6FA|nr:EAL domain-containing protein [Psychromonas sp. Urea-02u-13]PKG39280.1 GGDEF domain-containing protein [Psychromonas sp. Urea-02u-13]